jgi:hypothetical protein
MPDETGQDLRRRSFVADSNARLRLTASMRRRKDKSSTSTEAEQTSPLSAAQGIAPGSSDAPQLTIEGVLVLAEEPMDEDEIDPAANTESSTAMDALVEESEDNSAFGFEQEAATTGPGGGSASAVAAAASDSAVPSGATAATGKRLDARLRLPKVEVTFTEEEIARYRRLGLMPDPAAPEEPKSDRSRIYTALNPDRLYAEQGAGANANVCSSVGAVCFQQFAEITLRFPGPRRADSGCAEANVCRGCPFHPLLPWRRGRGRGGRKRRG